MGATAQAYAYEEEVAEEAAPAEPGGRRQEEEALEGEAVNAPVQSRVPPHDAGCLHGL